VNVPPSGGCWYATIMQVKAPLESVFTEAGYVGIVVTPHLIVMYFCDPNPDPAIIVTNPTLGDRVITGFGSSHARTAIEDDEINISTRTVAIICGIAFFIFFLFFFL
jgi:hypothetical protein